MKLRYLDGRVIAERTPSDELLEVVGSDLLPFTDVPSLSEETKTLVEEEMRNQEYQKRLEELGLISPGKTYHFIQIKPYIRKKKL